MGQNVRPYKKILVLSDRGEGRLLVAMAILCHLANLPLISQRDKAGRLVQPDVPTLATSPAVPYKA
jgi:hypothetical protein